MTDSYDLVVIGAGPAGLSAATEGAARGLSVLLLDEQPGPGGQIYRASETSPLAGRGVLGPEYERGRDLAAAFRASAAEYSPRSTVTDITRDGWVGIDCDGAIRYVHGRRILIATGAMERPFPIRGWTLPGVMTAGAAQTLLKSAGAVPGSRTVMAGSGPLLYLLAWQILQTGQPLHAILDTAAPSKTSLAVLSKLPGAMRKPSYLVKGLRLLAAIKRSGVRHVQGVTGLSAEGDGALNGVTFERGGKSERLDADLLLLHQGVVPNIQLTQALRCDHRWDDGQLCWRPVTDDWGVTSVANIAVAGDGGGIGGAVAAEYAGRVAAIGAAIDAGRVDSDAGAQAAQPLRAALARDLAARPLLDALYRPADGFRVPEDDAVVACRCEEVTIGEIRKAARMGATGPNQLKAFLRAGMGACQGRLCGLTVSETIARERGQSPAETGYYRIRPPFKPVTLGALASMSLPRTTGYENPEEPANPEKSAETPSPTEFRTGT
ncbi:NAD(P)/FAD-dependent oxidoreductase [Fodinicurvata sp. EGI_FJ10296]|uniref:NAD(P)/FAD-dependent oxidoreductase n=1 Tax=Fodinicurvata sp. EGI_FJ10296 TaxID=3231908 RepID=UPI00345474A7